MKWWCSITMLNNQRVSCYICYAVQRKRPCQELPSRGLSRTPLVLLSTWHTWSCLYETAMVTSLHLSIDLVITSEGAESRCFVLPKKPRDHQISMSAYPPHSHRMRPRSSLNEEVTAVSLLLPARPSWYSSNLLGSLVGDQGGRADRNCMKL